MPEEPKVLVVGAYPNSMASFRGDLIRSLVAEGCGVTAMAAEASSEVVEEIEALGAEYRPYPIKRNGLDPHADFRTCRALSRAFREFEPDAILAYTIKPIIWGGIAAGAVPKARFFAMVTGLGYAFQGTSVRRRALNALVTRLYRRSLRNAEAVVFQNRDNRDVFLSRGIVPPSKCHVVSGSGIDTELFPCTPIPEGPPRFLLIARLLGEKGIREYVAAAGMVKQRYSEATFTLVGPEDPSPDGIPLAEVQQWHAEGSIEYAGATNDVRPHLASCHVYCLPSYHEGMPRTVLEAMAMGRPILTTDVSGCKETVVPGQNGWLVPHADAKALAERMIWFIENRDRWPAMGQASRRMAEERFDVRKVNAEMLRIMGIGKK